MNILEKIVESKKREIERLYEQHDLADLQRQLSASTDLTTFQKLSNLEPLEPPRFYQALAEAGATGQPFFIAEFKRKSPSEGWINQAADLPAQVRAYAQAGAGAVSVLTDEPFFGGSYADLKLAAETLANCPPPSFLWRASLPTANSPLLLQKDFILDPIQIYLAKLHSADIILLIAAILEPEQLDFLKKTAESLGMGVLVEVHDGEELAKIQHLDFPALGVNNRDLKTFRTALNRVNVLKEKAGGRFVISESGIRDYRDFRAVRNADGFLIGTGLMREGETPLSDQTTLSRQTTAAFSEHFQSQGKLLFKACGIRTLKTFAALSDGVTLSHPVTNGRPDFIGINFSPVSKRRIDPQTFQVFKTWKVSAPSVVAVFYKNSQSEIRDILEQYPFRAVQLYAGDVTPAFVRSLKQRVILALQVRETTDLQKLEPFAADVDFFILDGASPGSGQRIGAAIPMDFPYPFLLAGGLHEGNLEVVLQHDKCIGVDIASGIETEGQVDLGKIETIIQRLTELKKTSLFVDKTKFCQNSLTFAPTKFTHRSMSALDK